MNKIIPGKQWLASGALVAAMSLTGAPAWAAQEVLALQNALYGAGYDIEQADGRMGPSTVSALKAFQTDHPELQVSGKLDDPTKKALGMVPVQVAAASVAEPAASAPADVAPEPASEPEEGAVEEEDDGDWLFF
ncbi:peptidoglycan-binding domain-containing protein [Marinobacter sp. JSM 1782161]|uniref:peptidoglycan-binding domain-containing protein n=1 Tax=Marinobacter sp. JSM 1782161 TaxID=2685906 RepID=UPI0014020A90|nr:peptidoglycan-binding domain-containing protein [Marinobacter sp. JSM 1782161]